MNGSLLRGRLLVRIQSGSPRSLPCPGSAAEHHQTFAQQAAHQNRAACLIQITG